MTTDALLTLIDQTLAEAPTPKPDTPRYPSYAEIAQLHASARSTR
jgi:hypothetical protein